MKLQLCDSEPFQVQVCSYLYSVCSMYTNPCPDLCDPKRYRQEEARKVCRVLCGLLRYCYYRNFTLLHSQEPATCSCPKPDNLVHASPTDLFKVYFNIILTSTLRSSRRLLSFTFPDKPVRISPLPHMSHMSRPASFS